MSSEAAEKLASHNKQREAARRVFEETVLDKVFGNWLKANKGISLSSVPHTWSWDNPAGGTMSANDNHSSLRDDWQDMIHLARERERADRLSKDLEEFWRLAHTDNTVCAVVQAWRHGGFPSFEAMLLHLVGHLAREKAKFFNLICKASASSTNSIIVEKVKETP